MQDLRCKKCNKLLGKYYECKHLEIKCPRCGENNLVQDKITANLQAASILSDLSRVSNSAI